MKKVVEELLKDTAREDEWPIFDAEVFAALGKAVLSGASSKGSLDDAVLPLLTLFPSRSDSDLRFLTLSLRPRSASFVVEPPSFSHVLRYFSHRVGTIEIIANWSAFWILPCEHFASNLAKSTVAMPGFTHVPSRLIAPEQIVHRGLLLRRKASSFKIEPFFIEIYLPQGFIGEGVLSSSSG